MSRSDIDIEMRRTTVAVPVTTFREPDDDVNLWSLAARVLRHSRTALLVAGGILLLGIPLIWWNARELTYTSRGSLVPPSATAQPLSALAGVAAQYGMQVPGRQNSENPQFYADLLRSRRLLTATAEAKYTITGEDGAGRVVTTLVDYYGKKRKNPALRREAALKQLDSDLNVDVSKETGIVQFSVAAPQPTLARDIANQILAQVHQYNLVTRQSSAAAERRFVQDRLAEERVALARAEETLEQFYARNRQFDKSADLRFDHNRFERDVLNRQQVVASLLQAFEEAKIAEVRNTPVVSVLDTPEVPARPDPRGRLKSLVVLLIVASIFAIVAAIVADAWERLKASDSSAYKEFRTAVSELGRTLRWRRRTAR